MFRLWGKIWKDNRMLQDTVVCDDSDDTRTHKIFHGLEEICYQMDLGNPAVFYHVWHALLFHRRCVCLCHMAVYGVPVPDAVWHLLCILCRLEGAGNLPQPDQAGGGTQVCGPKPDGTEKTV